MILQQKLVILHSLGHDWQELAGVKSHNKEVGRLTGGCTYPLQGMKICNNALLYNFDVLDLFRRDVINMLTLHCFKNCASKQSFLLDKCIANAFKTPTKTSQKSFFSISTSIPASYYVP